MDITVTQFKAKCLGIVQKVQEERCRVTISRHGKPAAELVPISGLDAGEWFGRAKRHTRVKGDIFSAREGWDAEH